MQVYNEMFTDASPERTERMFHYLDPDNTGYVDYLGWSQSIKLQVPSLSYTSLHFCSRSLHTACACHICFPFGILCGQ